MLKTIAFFSFLFIQTVNSADYSEIGIPVSNVYGPEVHKGSNQNWWLVQTDNGLIYNGTGTGINEWDGEKWSLYQTPLSSRVRSLAIAADGRIYVGTNNDFGYFSAHNSGGLTFTSLIENWTFEQHQFGEITSVAVNDKGVLFAASKSMYFWNGKKVEQLSGGLSVANRVFSHGNQFIYKRKGEENFQVIETEPSLTTKQADWQLPQGAKIRQILINQKNNMVAFTDLFGVFELINNEFIQRLDPKDFPSNTNLYQAIQARDGYYYVTSLNQGLFILSKELKLIRQYTEEHKLGMNTILSILEDTQGNIWLSGVPNIIKMTPPHVFSTFATDGNSKASENIGLFQNKITVAGNHLYQITMAENNLSPAYFKSLTPQQGSMFHFIEYKGHLVSTGEGGIFTQKIMDDGLRGHKQLIDSFLGRYLAIDPISNSLFATTYDGLYRIESVDSELYAEHIEGTADQLENIIVDQNGTIWIGTATQELYKIDLAQYPDKAVEIHKYIDTDGLGKNNVIPFKISSGVVFGTNDGLMNFRQDRELPLQFVKDFPAEIFNSKDRDIFRLYEDKMKRLWFRAGGRTGFIKRDGQKANGDWIINEDVFKPVPDSGYKGFVVAESNIVWVTMANGQIFRLDIDRMNDRPSQGKLNIRKVTNLDTGDEIYGGLNTPLLPLLDQQHNSIRINYALTENVIPRQKNYRYRLMGSNHEKWSPWSTEKHKDFTLLQGNDYQFQVESKDAWGRINTAELNFTVEPVWYLSRTAWFAYIISFMLSLILVGWLTQKWRHKQLNLRNKQLEIQVKERTADVLAQAKELKQQQILKDRFFTNVSHEFRTPLTLVIAPLTSLIQDNPHLDPALLHPIDTALRNSKKMLSLVGEVLDINKLESGRFSLHVEQHDIAVLIKNSIISFKPWAEKNNQTLSANNTKEPLYLYFDWDQIERCLSNLLSNAIKYSGKNSQITISVINDTHQTGIKVSDTGKGISKTFKDKVFQRYTQDKISKNNSHVTPGTDIGLALVSELMVLHQGQVELISDTGSGCSFILWLKHGSEHFNPLQLIKPVTRSNDSVNAVQINPLETAPKLAATDIDQNSDITTVLIVDDNHELRDFLVVKFSDYFKVLEADNGKKGLAMAQHHLPDLIISDVMMPVMDGLEMTTILKASKATQFIPVILLTAKSTKRETVEGIQSGADDYLTKPFDTSELIVRAIGLINNQKHIRKKIQLELSQQISSAKNTSSFAEALQAEILCQLSNPKMNIDSLSIALATSRSSLNRKCKEKLNKSPLQLITQTRMRHALILLKANKHSVSEVAYGIGYESLAAFSKVFKKHYGQNPSAMK